MNKRYEIRLSGSGGQGLVLAGVILAEAAAIYDEKNAVQSQSYGPEARGGASKSDVIISDDDIDYPKATNVNTLLALTQEACDKYSHDLRNDGILIYDGDMVSKLPEGSFKTYKFHFIKAAKTELGKEYVANIVALGTIVGLTSCVTLSSLKQAVLARVPKGTEELNEKALNLGLSMAQNAIK